MASVLGFCLIGNDPRPAGQIAVFSGVGNTVSHVAQAALIHQIDDQLDLVHTLEIAYLRLIPRVD
jgi:hypothetical protein